MGSSIGVSNLPSVKRERPRATAVPATAAVLTSPLTLSSSSSAVPPKEPDALKAESLGESGAASGRQGVESVASGVTGAASRGSNGLGSNSGSGSGGSSGSGQDRSVAVVVAEAASRPAAAPSGAPLVAKAPGALWPATTLGTSLPTESTPRSSEVGPPGGPELLPEKPPELSPLRPTQSSAEEEARLTEASLGKQRAPRRPRAATGPGAATGNASSRKRVAEESQSAEGATVPAQSQCSPQKRPRRIASSNSAGSKSKSAESPEKKVSKASAMPYGANFVRQDLRRRKRTSASKGGTSQSKEFNKFHGKDGKLKPKYSRQPEAIDGAPVTARRAKEQRYAHLRQQGMAATTLLKLSAGQSCVETFSHAVTEELLASIREEHSNSGLNEISDIRPPDASQDAMATGDLPATPDEGASGSGVKSAENPPVAAWLPPPGRSPENYTAEDLTSVLQNTFGHKDFRPGQCEAVSSVLARNNTLLLLSTGSGKSLCYQIPAFLLREEGLTLVVSPLVSLMSDQLMRLPGCLRGAIVSSQQSRDQSRDVLRAVRARLVDVLFVSPERLSMWSFDGCGLPPIALACIDEAHCVSEWSHNFRPDYLRLHEFLVGSLGARRLLALTATATRPTIKSICEILKVGTVVRSDRSFTVEDLMAEASQPKVQRTNLCMNARILPDEDLQVAELIKILKSEEHSRHSVIIYVWRRATAEQLSKQLRAHVKGGIRAYHGSMLPEARRAVQEAFMTGTARVVVATVAFGMGLDKSNIRTVIHFGLPKSIENYIQETGRCSRDGAPGQCIALVSPKDYKTMRWLESGGGGGGSQASVVRKLLGMLFRPGETGPCQKHELCEDAIKVARVGLDPGPEGEDVPPANGSWKPYCVAFDEKETAQTLNCPADELHSALAHLSRHARGHMNLLSKFPTKIKLRFFGIDANELAKQDWLIRQVLPLSKKIGAVYSIDTAKALAVMGGTAGQLSSGLWGARGKEFAVEKADYGYMVSVLRPVDEAQLEAWSAEISGINARARQSAVEKLDASFIALSRAAEAAQSAGSDAAIAASKANDALTTLIDAYFSATEDPSAVVAGDGEVRRRLLSSALGQEYTTVSGHQFARVPMPQPRSGFSAGAASANSGGAPSDAQGQTKGDQPVEILQGTVVCATVARLVLSPDWPTISNQEPDAVAHAVAQFLGGMSSVVLPAKKWKEHRFWGRFRGIGDFQYLEELVKGAIVKIQGLKSARPMP